MSPAAGIDVPDTNTDTPWLTDAPWRSLHWRVGTCTFPAHPSGPLTATIEDEGMLQPTSAQVVVYDGNVAGPEVYIHEGLFQWRGFSLAARRPQANADGTIPFSDGSIEFLDPSDGQTIRARADLTSVVANPDTQTFTGAVTNFSLGNRAAGNSTLADALVSSGGQIVLDPGIVTASSNFSETANFG